MVCLGGAEQARDARSQSAERTKRVERAKDRHMAGDTHQLTGRKPTSPPKRTADHGS